MITEEEAKSSSNNLCLKFIKSFPEEKAEPVPVKIDAQYIDAFFIHLAQQEIFTSHCIALLFLFRDG